MGSQKKENVWNFMSMLVFLVLAAGFAYALQQKGIIFKEIAPFDFMILILASYRLTRVLVYDKVFKYFRDLMRSWSKNAFFNSVKEILACPWCAGVWATLIMASFYYLVPYGDVLTMLMAIAGVGTFIQMTINLIGIRAKETQQEVKYKEKIRS